MALTEFQAEFGNKYALEMTIATGEAYYYSCSCKVPKHKKCTSGLVQCVQQLLIDDDQDYLWMKVDVAGLGTLSSRGILLLFVSRDPYASETGRLRSPCQACGSQAFSPRCRYQQSHIVGLSLQKNGQLQFRGYQGSTSFLNLAPNYVKHYGVQSIPIT